MPPKTSRKPAIQAGDAPPAETIRRAIEELGLNRPFYTCRIVGSRLEFSLYGGDLVYWPPKRARPRKGQDNARSSPSGRGPHSVGWGREK